MFYDLAELHHKNKWGYAILGVASYYIGTFIFGVVLAIFSEVFELGLFDGMNDWSLNMLALPFGLLASWGTYSFLKRDLKKRKKLFQDDILDDDLF